MLDRFGRRKVRLFRFAYQGRVWLLAQSDRNVITGAGTVWTAAPIERDDIRLTAEPAKDRLAIRIRYLRDPAAPLAARPATQSLGDLWHPWIPTDTVGVMCLEHIEGSGDPPKVQWIGHVAQPSFTDVELELSCEPGSALSRAADQGPRVQRACWKAVYSTGPRGCNLVRADFETTAALESVAGLYLTAPEFDGLEIGLLGGTCEWSDASGIRHGRMITSHAGATIRIHFGGPGLGNGTNVLVFPNCEQTWDACAKRRPDPQNHYGGAIYLPVENPMSGGVSMSWG